MPDPPADLTFRAVETSTWPDFERLFSSRGAPHYLLVPGVPSDYAARPVRLKSQRTLKSAMCEADSPGRCTSGCWPTTAANRSAGARSRRDRTFPASEDHIRQRCGRRRRLEQSVRVVADVLSSCRGDSARRLDWHRACCKRPSTTREGKGAQSSGGLPGGPGFAGLPVRRFPPDVPGRRLSGN